jgi:hypothetical protein
MGKNILYFIALYLVVLAFHGYTYGENDQIEQLSYTKYLLDNSLYNGDFYINYISKQIPNERYFTAYLLSIFGDNLEWTCFFLHGLISIGLFAGLFRIAKRYIEQDGWIWLALLTLFVPMYKINLGGNDLYYNELLSGNLSKTVGVWAFVFFLEKKYLHFSIFAIFATLFHAVAGAQVMVLASSAYLINAIFIEKKWKIKENKDFLLGFLLYSVFAGTWLILLLKNFAEAKLSNEVFYDMINFRIPHHFIPSAFGQKNYLILLPIFAFTTYFFYKKEKMLFGIFLTSLSIAAIYTLAVEVFHSPILFSTQWFKSTIWLKAFAVFAIFSWFSDWLFVRFVTFFNFINIGKLTLLLSAFFAFKMMKNPEGRFQKIAYHFPFSDYKNKNEYAIELKFKDLVDKKAIFVQPASITSLKFFSERSSYIDYKTVVHSHRGFAEWYKRVQAVYKLNTQNRDFSISAIAQADQNFYKLKETDFMELKNLGVTHIFTKKSHVLAFPKITENEEFVVYSIQQ